MALTTESFGTKTVEPKQDKDYEIVKDSDGKLSIKKIRKSEPIIKKLVKKVKKAVKVEPTIVIEEK